VVQLVPAVGKISTATGRREVAELLVKIYVNTEIFTVIYSDHLFYTFFR